MKASFHGEAFFVGESKGVVWDERNMVDEVVWFMSRKGDNERDDGVGLNRDIFEKKIRWEENVGWVGCGEKGINSVRCCLFFLKKLF